MRRLDRLLLLVSAVGLVVFVAGYAIAVPMYPGGNEFDRARPGYDLADNYLCDAFRARAYDGQPNEVGSLFGQIGMLGLVIAAAAVLFAAPGTFHDVAPRLALVTRGTASLAFAGMLLVPLTPAHEYGLLHFAAVGLAAIPSLAASYLAAIGVRSATRDGTGLAGPLRVSTSIALAACTLHFGQYLAQVARVLGESVWVPRAQKLVVVIVVAWIALLVAWARARLATGVARR